MKKVTAVVIGAGSRGFGAYVNKANPGTLSIVGVAEPHKERMDLFKKTYGLSDENCFGDYKELFSRPRIADLAIICTNDRMHVEPARLAVEKGYHVLLEKPISPIPEEVYEVGKLAEKSDQVFSICHVLRYTKFYTEVKKILDSGKLGKIMTVVHTENVGFWHQCHSFVRGHWRNSDQTSPMLLAKSCHDLDLLIYLIGGNCKKVSSFGDLTFFKKENAPEGAPARCLDGCPHYSTCQFNAVNLYLNTNLRNWCKLPFNIPDLEDETIINALKTNQWGRCVFHCDNNVVDHQVVNMEFDNSVTVAFTMTAFTKDNTRTTSFLCTDGEMYCNLDENEIIIKSFKTGNEEKITIAPCAGGHSGGDHGLMNSVIGAINGSATDKSSAAESVQSHMIAFAAEKSRKEGITVDMDEFTKSIAERANSK